MKAIAILLLVLVCSWTGVHIPPAIAADTVNGSQIFSFHCAGCHINGGNIVRRSKTLKKPALKKYGMDSLEAVTAIVTNGKSNMSAYKDRLTAQEIADVAAYVLEQAETNWR
ncbi:MAG: c-type cytochrome [Goleter apudmare HA4340-LM2]|nr:c-type cytochrome [Goleter apudmare HA4340-LM2]